MYGRPCFECKLNSWYIDNTSHGCIVIENIVLMHTSMGGNLKVLYIRVVRPCIKETVADRKLARCDLYARVFLRLMFLARFTF